MSSSITCDVSLSEKSSLVENSVKNTQKEASHVQLLWRPINSEKTWKTNKKNGDAPGIEQVISSDVELEKTRDNRCASVLK